MPWLQLRLRTTQPDVEAVTDYLSELGSLSVTFEDAEDNPILEPAPGETPLWNQLKVTALFDAEVDTNEILTAIASHSLAQAIVSPHFEALEDKDWERAWMDNFHPMQFGEKVWIVPSWKAAPEPNAVNIMLDPGLAFGTGTHPTTSLCLKWMDSYSFTNKTVLDYGCGSGILAITAAKLGAKSTSAIDIDPQAIIATKDNMARNDLPADAIDVGMPDIVNEQTFDVVVANILAGPLAELSESISALVKSEGQLVLSGLLAEQAEEVSKVYSKWFNMQPPVQQEDWVRLEGVKKQ
ncbi:50S ribosomal protein L11 methyltransferase [Pleionea sp. CnH1-48]|uniref:50S ribosomal protein L11 methyltransferase n=1 Tax=Pleionea sp. CnH1-48 TaxID=2954494 RepID=UPI0020974FBC|nr:50S ribosomal protein L11 methyltransferase [Pleionea sp. CnH1-48]MCO7224673.1 50S ribosomal protein L11 methyltransferase [Pleionea sp. CnH1-48]